MKILSIFGTRPEAIKMAPVVLALANAGIKSQVCVTAQHRGMLDQVLALFGIAPDYDLDIMKANQGLTHITTAVLQDLAPVLETIRPDRVLVHGDTTTTFAAALAAFYQHIPVAHVEAGLRTGNINAPWPEEMNRRLADQLCDLYFAPTEQSRLNLLREGIGDGHIVVTGNTVIDALFHVVRLLAEDEELRQSLSRQFPMLAPAAAGDEPGAQSLRRWLRRRPHPGAVAPGARRGCGAGVGRGFQNRAPDLAAGVAGVFVALNTRWKVGLAPACSLLRPLVDQGHSSGRPAPRLGTELDRGETGAGEGIRTLDFNLGKVALYP